MLGALAGAAGVALTATAGWLIVRSAEHPPVLLLIGAIVGVRTFGLARPALRYVERLVVPRRGAAAAGRATRRRSTTCSCRWCPGGSARTAATC